MAEIINVYTESAPESRFIGIKYNEDHRVDGSFAHLWQDWFEHGRFQALEALASDKWAQIYPEAESYVGLMRSADGRDFEYWIGMFTPPDTRVPAGFDSLDMKASRLGVCWVKGTEPDIYCQEERCLERLKLLGETPDTDDDGSLWVMERYQCPRFTETDEQGQKILDLVTIVKARDSLAGKEDAGGSAVMEEDAASRKYCASCRLAFTQETCPECKQSGTPLKEDDPIYIGELPGRLRNALQIAFQATEIPFTALPTLGSGFTLTAGDIFETYKVYVPFFRSQEAKKSFEGVFLINDEG